MPKGGENNNKYQEGRSMQNDPSSGRILYKCESILGLGGSLSFGRGL